jgi:4-amino-4-deoxy-L-arabinose transferase-like glycosyltransferase
MNIGKAAIAVFLILLLSFSMLAIFSILKHDQSTDSFYTASSASTINQSANLTESVLGTGIGFITPMTLVVAILFLLAAFLIFRRI